MYSCSHIIIKICTRVFEDVVLIKNVNRIKGTHILDTHVNNIM